MRTSLHLPEYAIHLGAVSTTLPEWLQERQYSRIFLITDRNTHQYCQPRLTRPEAGPEFVLGGLQQPLGSAVEPLKTLLSCEAIWSEMLRAGLDRKSLVINLGGGVVGDMGGFCAATYKRGIDFIQIPTTLLAMTDAAIGGKLGIDFQGIKNTLGVFRNPAAVFVDPVFLQTLPLRELKSGLAEVIKHAIIGDPALWQRILILPEAEDTLDTPAWLELLEASIAVKTKVVQADPYEAGIRALLNFGHTFGHAVESYFLQTEAPLTHGEAVALGMICEGLLEQSGAWVAPKFTATIFQRFSLPQIPETAFDAIWALMQQDKKNASGAVRMAVPDAEPYSMQLLELSRATMEKRLQTYNQLAAVSL